MRRIEIAVDSGVGDERRQRNGRQDGSGRTAGRPRQGREMGSVHLIFLILMREILRVRSQLRISQTGTSEQAANKQLTRYYSAQYNCHLEKKWDIPRTAGYIPGQSE
jgi:hypothetical protein